MSEHSLRILVTGARGLVGAETVARLAGLGHSVVAFLRSDGDIVRNDGRRVATQAFAGAWPAPGAVACVHGDVSLDNLGLEPIVYGQLQRSAELVLHCAAITSFGRAPEKYEATNFRGTERMVAFAAARRTKLIYVSTAYVCGERPGQFHESDLELGQTHGNPYENSKFRAERAVRAAMADGLPGAVIRPSIIVGDSRTGIARKFDTIYTVVRVTAAGLVRTLPGDYGAVLDIVPIDYVAEGVVEAVQNFDRIQGQTLHLTSGAPVTLRDVNDVCAEFPSFHVPRYVPRHVFDTSEMGPIERRTYNEVVKLYESYLTRQIRFSRSATEQLLAARPASGGKTLLRRIFRYGIHAGYFAARAA